MNETGIASEERKPLGLGAMRRKAVDVTELVQTSLFDENPLPLVVGPATEGVDLADWAATHRDQVDGWFDKHGAILFRGFGLAGVEDFERVAGAVAGELFAEYGDLPPEPTSQRVYGSTPYPPDKMILFHNESSHLPTWPMRQFFYCVIPSETGGTTPLLDSRAVYNALDPEIRAQFETKGLTYVRNFAEGIDVPWQEFFHTSERAEVERTCAESGMTCEWTANDGLRIRQLSPAVVSHPRTGEKLFFNQVQLHHVYCLDPETRSSLGQLFAEEDMPRNVYFGDGTPIPDETMEYIGNLYEELCVDFPWQATDLVAVDNMLVQHARRPFSGERKLLVAMAQMSGLHELAGNGSDGGAA
jgi:alpha-ketoglutarate-dependent taurine dioxygenase